jgi:ribonuclease E
LLINVSDPGEARVAILTDGRLDEFYVERAGRSLAGNIYRGVVTNVEPSLQAAFVNIGQEKNGFLHVSDCISPDGGFSEILTNRGRRRRPQPNTPGVDPRNGDGRQPIENMLHKGQDVLVQVLKDGLGSKGPAVTTYLSLPGRYLVLMPGLTRLGVSKKIEDDAQREELRNKLSQLTPPAGLGFIARTACVGHPLEDISRDMEFLVGLWNALAQRARESKSPSLIYQESDLVIRAVRDYLPPDAEAIVIDSAPVLERIKNFLALVIPDILHQVQLHREPQPIFHHYGVERELAKLGRRRVKLPSGGVLVIEQTEALVAVDVNTAGYRGHHDQPGAVLQTNIEAAREIAQQLRLRDIGGLVVIDFIDMETPAHNRQVEKELRDAMERDRAKTFIAPMSPLGIIELSRQRTRPGLARSTFVPCPTCGGQGTVKSAESLGLVLLREAKVVAGRGDCSVFEARLSPADSVDISNRFRAELVRLEESANLKIIVAADPGLQPGRMSVLARNETGTKMFEQRYEEVE